MPSLSVLQANIVRTKCSSLSGVDVHVGADSAPLRPPFLFSQDDCDRDFFMTPEEAMDYGLIDEVVTTKTSHIAKPAMPSLEEVM